MPTCCTHHFSPKNPPATPREGGCGGSQDTPRKRAPEQWPAGAPPIAKGAQAGQCAGKRGAGPQRGATRPETILRPRAMEHDTAGASGSGGPPRSLERRKRGDAEQRDARGATAPPGAAPAATAPPGAAAHWVARRPGSQGRAPGRARRRTAGPLGPSWPSRAPPRAQGESGGGAARRRPAQAGRLNARRDTA